MADKTAAPDYVALNKALLSDDVETVKGAQRTLGVPDDGRVGPQTWGAHERIRPAGTARQFMTKPRAFFDAVRPRFRDRTLTPDQVDGMNHLFEVWGEHGTTDYRHLAYALATVFHETGQKMVAVREGFAETDAAARRKLGGKYRYAQDRAPKSGRSKERVTNGHWYYGRGDVQLTWFENYERMGRLLHIDLVNNPDLALDRAISKRILVEGLTKGMSNRGDFTGVSVEDFIRPGRPADYVNARKVVNGLDHAHDIAGYAEWFENALEAAGAR